MASQDIHLPNESSASAASGEPSGSRTSRLSKDEFARQFRDTWRVLWCIAAGETGDRSAADDIVQQAAVIALERMDDFDPSTSFLAWMAQIVRYTAMNEVQKVRRRRTTSTDPSSMDTSSNDMARAAGIQGDKAPISRFGHLLTDQNVFDDRLLEALRTLDTVARSCLLLRIVLDSPYKEISLVLGIPQGTAMSHVDRARRALRTHLSSHADPGKRGASS
ncbi:MAG: sigma-70 family RNA polymerase sigma factor [Phycisphaerales bacterium]|nr:sigma-70 family RNA polymerase sigma factor [Phycisphaerales bacterium]